MNQPTAPGLMWYEPDQNKPFETILAEAAQHLKNKYQESALACHVNPAHFTEPPPQVIEGIEIVIDPEIIVKNYWLTA